jgi:hypothetical protein
MKLHRRIELGIVQAIGMLKVQLLHDLQNRRSGAVVSPKKEARGWKAMLLDCPHWARGAHPMNELLLFACGIVLAGGIVVFLIWAVASWLLRGDNDIDGWWN